MYFVAILSILNKNKEMEMRDFNQEAFIQDCQAKVTEALLSGEAYKFEYDLDQVVDFDVSMANVAQAADWYLTTVHADTFNKLLGKVMEEPTEATVSAMRQFFIEEMSIQIALNELEAFTDFNDG